MYCGVAWLGCPLTCRENHLLHFAGFLVYMARSIRENTYQDVPWMFNEQESQRMLPWFTTYGPNGEPPFWNNQCWPCGIFSYIIHTSTQRSQANGKVEMVNSVVISMLWFKYQKKTNGVTWYKKCSARLTTVKAKSHIEHYLNYFIVINQHRFNIGTICEILDVVDD